MEIILGHEDPIHLGDVPGPVQNEAEGGPAFPVEDQTGIYYGMSLRDYFAGQALAGLCASLKQQPHDDPKGTVETAYAIADAMLAERAKAEGRPA